jgi:CysZ protein
LAASLILVYHQEILSLIWAKPESRWILWLWYAFSWLLSLVLVGLSAVISYLVSQILFSVLIMD